MDRQTLSEGRKKYLRKVKTNKILVFVTQILVLAIFLIGWEQLANKGVIDSFITSQPSRILETFLNLGSNGLLKHIGVTSFETIVGFTLGTLLGILIAIVLWWSNFLSKVAEPYLVVLNSLPKVALRTSYYYLGRSRNASYYCDGTFYFFNCYYFRKFKWFFAYR